MTKPKAAKPRNRRGTFGQLDSLKSGRIRARYEDPTGRVTEKGTPVRYTAPHTFDNRTDARAWLTLQHAAIIAGTWEPPAVMKAKADVAAAEQSETLAEYAARWLKTNRNRKGEPLRPRTVGEYERLLAGPLKDLAVKPLAEITVSDVDLWFADKSANGKLTQMSRAYSLLNTIMKHAIDRGRISANPCRVRGGQAARTGRKVIPPTDAELAIIVKTIEPRFVALVHLAAEGGLRYGEATDLHRSDLVVERDDDNNVVRVLVNVTHAVTRIANGFASGPPKSEAGIRSVYIYGRAAQAIADHLKTHVGRFGDPLLFTAIGGDGHLAPGTWARHWDPARKAAGREDMPFHALRHRAGTAYVQHGATMAEAMQRLGHTSTSVAMRYQHATGRDAEIAARMAGGTA